MRSIRLFLPMTLALMALAAPAARAQYMYLDSNGDGIHTDADVLHGTGPTFVSVWLDQTHNRDGTTATCDSEDGDLAIMNSFAVNLLATGGTVAFTEYVNRIPSFSIGAAGPEGIAFVSNGTSAEAAQASATPTRFDPVPVRLCTLVITVITGTPNVQIVDRVSGRMNYTAFGTACGGHDFDNTYKLSGPAGGSDWTDVDGLEYRPGGAENSPPTLSQPADMSAFTGAVSTQSVTAADPDLQPVSISMDGGPGFMHVLPISTEVGTVSSEIRLTPLASDLGSFTGRIAASDGVAVVRRSFAILVTRGPDHPPGIEAPARVSTVAGATVTRDLSAYDPDGDTPSIEIVSGPVYMTLTTLAARPGGLSARVTLAPGVCDVGTYDVNLLVRAGGVATTRVMHVSVSAPAVIPADSVRVLSLPWSPYGFAVGDLNEDGRDDLVMWSADRDQVGVLASTESGFLPPTTYAAGSKLIGLAISDFDADGHLDVASMNWLSGSVSILRGDGTGALVDRADFDATSGSYCLEAADVDRDGAVDLVTASDYEVAVLLGRGDGTFRPPTRFPVTPRQGFSDFLIVRDLDLDGRLDIVTATTCLRGVGGGAFESWGELPIAHGFGAAAADVNGDGFPDLVTVDWEGDARLLEGNGDGTFGIAATLGGFLGPQNVVSADFDADGGSDFAIADWYMGRVTLWHFESGAPSRVEQIERAPNWEVAVGDFTADGYPDLVIGGLNSAVILANRNGAAFRIADARAFLPVEQRAFPTVESAATFRVRLEPVGGSFEAGDVEFSALRMTSPGTGSVGSIDAIPAKSSVVADVDKNGTPDIGIAFRSEDLARLFDGVTGRRTVHPRLEGTLLDGARFCASFDLIVQRTGPPLVASVVPNPLNPSGSLRFLTSRAGRLRVRLYDVHGRLVRTLRDVPAAEPGTQTVPIDGLGSDGRPLGSGTYFYRIEAAEGATTGRLMILK